MKTTVIIAHHQKLFSDALKTSLVKYDDLEVIDCVHDGLSAVISSKNHQPDVAIVDIQLPKLNGIEVVRKISRSCQSVKVIALGFQISNRQVAALASSGAASLISDDCPVSALVNDIHRVTQPHSISLHKNLAVHFSSNSTTHPSVDQPKATQLTNKEREVLQLVAEGFTTKRIADSLFISQKTVSHHRDNICRKLNIHSIAGLTKYAIREGITSAHAV